MEQQVRENLESVPNVDLRPDEKGTIELNLPDALGIALGAQEEWRPAEKQYLEVLKQRTPDTIEHIETARLLAYTLLRQDKLDEAKTYTTRLLKWGNEYLRQAKT
jgi:hypothetical protein